MTVFAGVISLNDQGVSKEDYYEFKKKFELSVNTPVDFEFQDASNVLFSVNIGAYFEANTQNSDGLVTTIAGDPILNCGGERSCHSDLGLIHSSHKLLNLKETLQKARGVFAGVTIDTHTNNVSLFVDKLGIRPVFYYKSGNVLVYSSLLSYIESLAIIDLCIDPKGMCEYVSLGYCLSNRTPYKHIKRLDAGELIHVSISDKLVQTISYWDWNKIAVKPMLEENDVEDLFNKFDEAVKLRVFDNKFAVAFLSGGLDSRALTSLVNEHVEQVHTFNFATTKSQDNEYAKNFAESAGLFHNEKVLSTLSYPNWGQLIVDAIAGNSLLNTTKVNKQLVWSGDGGSVGIGGVYLESDFFKTYRSESAAEVLISSLKAIFPVRFLKKKYFEVFNGLLETSVTKELASYDRDLGNGIYHFLMDNDQKRHLQNHFETICEHKSELLLPFFDSEFLEKIYQIPSQELLGHNLYMKWFKLFPENTRVTPWQTYPNHEPCPIAHSQTFTYQWDTAKKNKTKNKEDFDFAMSLLKNKVVSNYFSKYKVIFAMLMHRYGLRDYGYLLEKLRRLSLVKSKVKKL